MKKIAILLSIVTVITGQTVTITTGDATPSYNQVGLNSYISIPANHGTSGSVGVYYKLTDSGGDSVWYEANLTLNLGGVHHANFTNNITITDLKDTTTYDWKAAIKYKSNGVILAQGETKQFATIPYVPGQLKVPSQYSTIQAGLNAARKSDTVLVAVGTYNENIIWPDVNGIKLISAGDSSNTIIDGGGVSSVIYMNPQTATIDTTTLIQGFKITNGGNIRLGGGMYLKEAHPLLKELNVTGNSTISIENTSFGGGIYILDCNLNIVDCSINNNNANNGGGVYILEWNENNIEPIFKNCIISNNYASTAGGIGISGTPTTTLINVTVSSNISKGNVGGMSSTGKTIFNNVRVIDNVVNASNGHSGGIYFQFNADLSEIENLIVANNIAYEGGGISYGGEGTLSNITIANNQSEYGALKIGGNTNIVNITIYGNQGMYAGIWNGYAGNNNSVGPNINSSNITNNGAGVYNTAQGIYADALNNYWGHSSGPYHPTQNPTGQGDSVNAYVNVDPWLTAPNTDAPPIPAQNLKLDSQTVTSATFSWDASNIGDLAGYKFYYDTDSSGYPYANSVDLGNVVTKSLTGLTTGKKYYVAVTTYDTDGNESWYSKEVAVQLNNTPVIAAVSDVTINEDESSTVTLSATDADGDALTYSAVSDTNAVTVSVSSSTLTLTPNSNWHGVANIKAYASDGIAKDSTSFKLTVTSVNDAPTLTAITETLSTDEETVLKVAFKGEDVDGDDLTYAYASDTSGVAATHNTAKDSLVLTPVTDFFGNAIITVTVSDGSLSDTSSFTLNVININDAPVLSGIQNQTTNEDEVIVVKLTATDLDGDVLTYSGIADTSAVTVTASNDTLKLTPKADWNGTSVITAIVSDGTISDSTSFTLNVNPVQDVPYPFDWVSPNERDTINVDKNNTATEYVFKWYSSKDVDGDALTYHFYVADTLIEVLSDTTTVGTYQDFLDHWPLQFQMLPRMTFTFNVWVHDGTDSVKVTGEPRKVLVNRYENLSTEGEGIPTEFALHENYPNPFNPTTTLRFDLPEVSSITLTIYNMLGQKVRTFNMQSTPAGYHTITWDATNDYGEQVGAGVYLYQLRAKQFVKTRKMVLLK